MNRLVIDLEALHHNIRTVDKWVIDHGASWSLVTKAMCGFPDVLRGLELSGVRSMADSRLSNLEAIRDLAEPIETWYLRLPHMPALEKVVRLADVSLNTEFEIIEALNREAGRQGKIHRIIIMIELGDLREGVLPGSLVPLYERVFDLPNIDVLGIGSNLGCLSGTVPSLEQFSQLAMFRELLQLKFDRPLPLISGGTSAVIPMLRDGQLPKEINHFRVGESVFLGTDLVHGDSLAGLRDDAITVEVEVVEVKEKSLSPQGETTDMTPFEDFAATTHEPGSRGYRAVITIGQLDTEVRGLRPLNPAYEIAGASSDLTVVHVGDNPDDLAPGSIIKFRPSYGALVRLMAGKYIDKFVTPTVAEFRASLAARGTVDMPPVLDDLDLASLEGEAGAEG
ncbi:amino-acid racemase [bacterium CG17_big_fil_post_rev_8_21_14_2_50_64_8]|nr:MAG: amino-acid racemase [bacterium CG17_big_fil_post_rev_8_21_14_2_50_64_8]